MNNLTTLLTGRPLPSNEVSFWPFDPSLLFIQAFPQFQVCSAFQFPNMLSLPIRSNGDDDVILMEPNQKSDLYNGSSCSRSSKSVTTQSNSGNSLSERSIDRTDDDKIKKLRIKQNAITQERVIEVINLESDNEDDSNIYTVRNQKELLSKPLGKKSFLTHEKEVSAMETLNLTNILPKNPTKEITPQLDQEKSFQFNPDITMGNLDGVMRRSLIFDISDEDVTQGSNSIWSSPMQPDRGADFSTFTPNLEGLKVLNTDKIQNDKEISWSEAFKKSELVLPDDEREDELVEVPLKHQDTFDSEDLNELEKESDQASWVKFEDYGDSINKLFVEITEGLNVKAKRGRKPSLKKSKRGASKKARNSVKRNYNYKSKVNDELKKQDKTADKIRWKKEPKDDDTSSEKSLKLGENSIDGNTRVGPQYQAEVLPFVANSILIAKRRPKLTWNPSIIEEEKLEHYYFELENILGRDITSEVAALKNLKNHGMNVEMALKNVKNNKTYFQRQFNPEYRVLRSGNHY